MRIFYLFILSTLFFNSFFNSSAFAKGNLSYCSQYAQTAVSQYQQNLQQHCGFTGLRWSNNKVGQMQWCMTVDERITANENQIRQHLLDNCSTQKNAKTNNPQQIDKSVYCDQYAQLAVEQNEQNKQRQCGFEGLRWSNDKKGQKQWCMAVRRELTAKENQARQGLLASCKLPQKRQAVLSKEIRVKPYKPSRVQQLFPQKAVKTSLQKLGFKNLNTFLKKEIRVPTYNFTLSHSGRWLAQGGDSNNDSALKLWDLQQGKLLFVLGEEKGGAYNRLRFSPNEKYLIAGDGYTTDIWEWKKGRMLFRLTDYYLPPFEDQAFDGSLNLYLMSSRNNSVARFKFSNGLMQTGKWNLATNHETIHDFALSKNGKIAVTVLTAKGVTLKVFDTQKNKLIYMRSLPPKSIYNKEGNYPSGRLLGFIDNENLAFYHLKSLNDQAYISRLNLKTKVIETVRLADDSAIRIEDFDLNKTKVSKNKLCPSSTDQLGWEDINNVHCELNKQKTQSQHIVSRYTITYKDQYVAQPLILHDSKANILAYFGADSNSHWYWLDAQSGELKNSGALWTDLPDPARKPNIYHFPARIVPLVLNNKTIKQYAFPKADIHRLEVFLGADDTVEYKPTIKPSFGRYALSHNGRWLAAGNLSGEGVSSFSLWDLKKNVYVKSFKSKIAWSHRSLAFSPDDRYLVIYYGSTRGHYAPCMECSSVVDIWDVKKSQYKFSIPLLDRNNYTSAPVIVNNGDMYLNINNKVVQRWNIKKERFIDIFRPIKKHEEVFSITGNGGDLLAISVKGLKRNKYGFLRSSKSWLEVWSISQHKMIQKITIMDKPAHYGQEFNVAFVSDRKIAVATTLNDIIIWDVLSGSKLKTLIPTKEFGSRYRLSSEGNGILIASGEFIQRWDISTGDLLMTVNACQPDMPGLPTKRYTQLKDYNGSGSAIVAAGKVVSAFSCPQGGRSKIWDMTTGENKALFGKDYKGEWFWLNDQETLKSTIPLPP